MKRLSIALLSLVISAVTWAQTPPALQDLPKFVQAPTDKAKFRRFTLDNGLKVLLVSDPKFNKSSAALVVHAGQIDDPRDTEGMAHFVEHLLFMGTEKYPSVTDYGSYISSNGGATNAYTTFDHTNFHFDVRHDALPGALDRFSQFFIAPLFNADFVGREVTAINNEAMRHVQNDGRRMIGVLRELYDPKSVESKFATGTKSTLAKADPKAAWSFYETHYSADRMALSIAGTASLDDLEKLARDSFSAIKKRELPPLVRVANFIPSKESLRFATMEPIKEARRLTLEFKIPDTHADFAGKSDQLLAQLISYPGEGGFLALLKSQGLINGISTDHFERSINYGSLFVSIELTPEGFKENRRVLTDFFSYLDFLRNSPFPASFFKDRAQVAQTNETYGDRGEGSALTARLANQALFYPLEIAERAASVWGKPDETSYRRLLAALQPSQMIAVLVAKGQPVDRKERIYETGYSFTESTGDGYKILVNPPKIAGFALPKSNRFMPSKAELLAERAVTLINEPGLQLNFLQDTEFQRPAASLVVRFVPVRELATAQTMGMLRLLDMTLYDSITPALGDAGLAGIEYKREVSPEGYKFTVTGYGDSSARFAQYIAEQLRDYKTTPERFAAMKELALRSIKSYDQNEANLLANDRRDAMTREFHFLPSEQLATVESATPEKLQAFAKRYFSKGRLEVLVHGNLTAEAATAVTRDIAAKIGSKAAPKKDLVYRRHVAIAANENVTDTGRIEGVNSVTVLDYQLKDSSPATFATSVVLGSFFREPFFTELRSKQQLGYIVQSAATASLRSRYFTFVIQSSDYGPVELRKRAETFIATLPATLSGLNDEKWAALIAGTRSILEQKPKGISEKAETLFVYSYDFDGGFNRRQDALAALDKLTKVQAVEFLKSTLEGSQAMRRTVMLHSDKHTEGNATPATFTDREKWKRTRKFE